MKTLFLLILLSRNGAGDINASFVNTENLEECQQKELVVKGIFSSAKIPVLERRCINSSLKFSEFNHSYSSNQPRSFYLITFSEETVTVDTMEDWKSCMDRHKRAINTKVTYCSSSIQSILKD